MPTLVEVEKLALDLPEADRAVLATALLDSLGPIKEEDEGIEEAVLRNSELDSDSESGMTIEQLDQKVIRRRK